LFDRDHLSGVLPHSFEHGTKRPCETDRLREICSRLDSTRTPVANEREKERKKERKKKKTDFFPFSLCGCVGVGVCGIETNPLPMVSLISYSCVYRQNREESEEAKAKAK
jgi:hypothetical protein